MDIEMRKRGRPFKYGYEQLQVGEAMSLPLPVVAWDVKRVRSSLSHHARKASKRFETCVDDRTGQMTITRVG